MKRMAVMAIVAAVAALAAGCDDSDEHGNRHPEHQARADEPREHRHHGGHRGFFSDGDGAIDMKGDVVVIRAGGQTGDAEVAPDGSLTIDGKQVGTSAEGRSALRTYDAEAVAFRQHAIAIGRAGAEFGIDTLKDVVGGLIDGTVEKAGDKAREGAVDLVANVRDLCGRMQAMVNAQNAAAAAIDEFKPYAVIEQDQIKDCYEELDDAKHDAEHSHDEDADADDEPPAPPEPPVSPGRV